MTLPWTSATLGKLLYPTGFLVTSLRLMKLYFPSSLMVGRVQVRKSKFAKTTSITEGSSSRPLPREYKETIKIKKIESRLNEYNYELVSQNLITAFKDHSDENFAAENPSESLIQDGKGSKLSISDLLEVLCFVCARITGLFLAKHLRRASTLQRLHHFMHNQVMSWWIGIL